MATKKMQLACTVAKEMKKIRPTLDENKAALVLYKGMTARELAMLYDSYKSKEEVKNV